MGRNYIFSFFCMFLQFFCFLFFILHHFFVELSVFSFFIHDIPIIFCDKKSADYFEKKPSADFFSLTMGFHSVVKILLFFLCDHTIFIDHCIRTKSCHCVIHLFLLFFGISILGLFFGLNRWNDFHLLQSFWFNRKF